MGKYSCRDRMCGAEDCNLCYPGNPFGQTCAECGEDYEDCECEEFIPEEEDDYDPREDYDDDRDDWEADRMADAYEARLFSSYDNE